MRTIFIILLVFPLMSGCENASHRNGDRLASGTQTESKPRLEAMTDAPPQSGTGQSGESRIPADGDAVSGGQKEREQERLHRERKLRTENFRQVKLISSRSRSVRLLFADGTSALFKPLLKGDSSARLEVAFYRLAELMGVETVPVSVMRPIYPSRLETAIQAMGNEGAQSFLDEMLLDDRGRVWGATIEWLENLEPMGSEDSSGRLDVKELFANEKYRTLWTELSDMVYLDYLLGNWDRFSGGNLFRLSGGNGLALIDHNEAFYRLSNRQQQKLDDSLAASRCPSEDFSLKLLDLTEEKVVSAVKTTEWTEELLHPQEIRNILKRKDTLRQFIDSGAATGKGLRNCYR